MNKNENIQGFTNRNVDVSRENEISIQNDKDLSQQALCLSFVGEGNGSEAVSPIRGKMFTKVAGF